MKNLMDATNLAIVFTPNLVSNEIPVRAIQMSIVSISNKSKDTAESARQSSHSQAANVVNLLGGPPPHAGTTLGTVVKVCIERYYEIFDEVRDVTEAVPDVPFEEDKAGKPLPAKRGSPASSNKELSSPSTSPDIATPASKAVPAATVLPSTHAHDAKPSSAAAHRHQPRVRGRAGPPPSAASASMALLAKALAEGTQQSPDEHSALLGGSNSRQYTYPAPSDDSSHEFTSPSDIPLAPTATPYGAPSVSMHSGGGGGARSGSGWTGGRGLRGVPKTRSIISIEKASGTAGGGGFSGRESIKLGKGTVTSGGTVRKSASAGVMGVGVTATGFFTSPH